LTARGGGSGQFALRRLPIHFSSSHLAARSSAMTMMMSSPNSRFESFNVIFDFSFTLLTTERVGVN
jgi:hypothetical protein